MDIAASSSTGFHHLREFPAQAGEMAGSTRPAHLQNSQRAAGYDGHVGQVFARLAAVEQQVDGEPAHFLVR